jgi:pyruvate/2-oxoglutarate/acetoin dehydrogenase E1 component
MTDNIVARLRDCTCVPHGEICREAADEMERLRAERDGARAEVCLLRAASTVETDTVTQSMADYAESRGWNDLFREDA